jgi:type II secretion system protein G
MRQKAFTLIELLIVVAIIAILAAIAVPNFLEAQTRSRTAKVKSEFRTISTALEAYVIDERHYPPSYGVGLALGAEQMEGSLKPLTTPVPYLTSVSGLVDPFANADRLRDERNTRPIYHYINYEALDRVDPIDWMWGVIRDRNNGNMGLSHRAYIISSAGPDRMDHTIYWVDTEPQNEMLFFGLLYDPTNGTMSYGDLGRMGGEVRAKQFSAALTR